MHAMLNPKDLQAFAYGPQEMPISEDSENKKPDDGRPPVLK
jgi:hypothetical protein